MHLVYYPDLGLTQVCKEAPAQSEKERAKMSIDMRRIMYDNNGMGLAANQVGIDIRMFVWMHDSHLHEIWNPTLSCVSGSSEEKEGCLSLPKIQVTMQRSISSILSGQGRNGLPLRYIGGELETRIWQHEIDHLDGKLIIDNMNHNETIANKKAIKKLLKNAIA